MVTVLKVWMVLSTVLNWGGGVVAAIWLIALGHWWLIAVALALLWGATFVLPLASTPGVLLFVWAAKDAEKTGRPHRVLFFLSDAYLQAVVDVWCVLVFAYFSSLAGERSVWPFLLLSYAVAIGPPGALALKETRAGDGRGAQMHLRFIEVGLVAAMVVRGVGGPEALWPALGLFGLLMLVSLVVERSRSAIAAT